jgi:hypothetical protein
MWDLQRNGGSVEGTTERILGGGGLEVVSLLSTMGIWGRWAFSTCLLIICVDM